MSRDEDSFRVEGKRAWRVNLCVSPHARRRLRSMSCNLFGTRSRLIPPSSVGATDISLLAKFAPPVLRTVLPRPLSQKYFRTPGVIGRRKSPWTVTTRQTRRSSPEKPKSNENEPRFRQPRGPRSNHHHLTASYLSPCSGCVLSLLSFLSVVILDGELCSQSVLDLVRTENIFRSGGVVSAEMSPCQGWHAE